MGTILVTTCLDDAATILQDEGYARFSEDELLAWFNAAVRDIVALKPDANTETEAVQLQAGTLQALPAEAIVLIDVPRNMGADGETPGRIINEGNRGLLDAQHPSWQTDTASATVLVYMYDPRRPKEFSVYPPQPAANQGYVDMVTSKMPATAVLTEETRDTETIPLDDVYANAIVHATVVRALLKDPEYAAVASKHLELTQVLLGTKEEVESINEPHGGR